MSLRRYSKYKESGVEWLGKVPSHWTVMAIKLLSPVQRGASPRPIDDAKFFDDEGQYAWVRIADVSASNGTLRETTQRMSELGSSLSVKIEPGELFVSIAGTVGKPCISSIKACIHDGFVYFPRLRIPPEFLYRVFEAGQCYAGLGKWGTQLNLNTDTIGSIRIAVPPSDDLSGILNFLDRETGKIDSLIAEQEKLLILLAEKRQATISQAVTRGLNPDAPMKDSGVAWLGEVPARWRVMPVRYVAKIGNGSTPNRDNPGYWTEGIYPWLNSSVVNQDVVLESEQFVTASALQECHLPIIEPPAVLLGITGQGRTRGMAATLMFEATINQHVAYIKPEERIVRVEFLRRVFDMAYQYLRTESDGGGSTKGAITCEQVGRLSIPIPEIDEQLAITAFLHAETNKLDILKAESERAIDLLKERRSALIAAAVTGKIDVRERSSVMEAAA
ncbi:restriction endonuclease subunit S [Paraburkholderia panacisoli]|uniref:Restriction endonuclease subunit S n=1 Tax=Paraburkholderia panacisoli TaxID=2603818 RepID=A0A5B0GTM5_9BURK|nr:restriction endonuclease subunit S [Paraburkholderia panacisoli]KAA1006219.1 restriction endonuclease subunit S [Paraburkholderia panacisoli]